MLFRRNYRKNEAELDSQINILLTPSFHNAGGPVDPAAFNAAGDLCHENGYNSRALYYYGLTIDAYLKMERWDSAAALCRKVLRLSPTAVRARCTLAWLAIGKGFAAEAQSQIRGYVRAAIAAGRDALAIAQLKRMGEAVGNLGVRQVVAEQLLALGDDRAADHLFGIVYQERNAKRRPSDNGELMWPTVRRAALLGPAELSPRR